MIVRIYSIFSFLHVLTSFFNKYKRWLDLGSALAILAVLSFLVVVSASLLYLVESDRCEERGLPCAGFETQRERWCKMVVKCTT